jgi:hypothetical protein
MRTSGGRGAEGWIMAIPIVALLVAASASNGGANGMLLMLETTVRRTVTSMLDFLAQLF